MSEQVTKYQYIDEDGDIHRFNYIARFCRCANSCEDDEIELFDSFDPPNSSPYRLQNICGSEMKCFLQDLIDFGVAAGKITEVQNEK